MFNLRTLTNPSSHKALGIGLVLAISFSACSDPIPPTSRASNALTYTGKGDAVKGRLVFDDQCQTCHSLQVGHNNKGPQLLGIYGANAALLAEYQPRYSNVLKHSGWVWNDHTLDTYITSPKKALQGSKMLYDGLPSQQDRDNVIAYLATLNH